MTPGLTYDSKLQIEKLSELEVGIGGWSIQILKLAVQA